MATKFNRFLNSAHLMAQRLSGAEAATWKRRNRVVQEMERLKLSPTRIKRMADVSASKRNLLRAKVGIGTLATGGVAFGGLKLNANRKERKLQERINQMYNNIAQY